MDETAQTVTPPAIQPEGSKFWRRFLPWITTAVVVALYVLVKVLLFVNPDSDSFKMHIERLYSMAPPGGNRKVPDPALLANFPALPTGWQGVPIAMFPHQPPPDRWSVNLNTGAFIHVQTDIYLPDVIPINLSRTYSSLDYDDRDFGLHASASYEIYLLGDNTVFSYINMIFPDGSIVFMPRISPGTSWDATYEHLAVADDHTDIFDQARLWWHSPWYFSSLKDGTGIVFPASRWAQEWGQRSAIMIQDAKGNVLDIKRDEAGNIKEITSPNGQTLVLDHDGHNRITAADDSHGHTISYLYDDRGRLSVVTDSNGEVTHYNYDIDGNMQTIVRPDGQIWITNTYDNRHRVIKQAYLDGSHASYAYFPPDSLGMTTTKVTRPDGSMDNYTFNKDGVLANRVHQLAHSTPIPL